MRLSLTFHLSFQYLQPSVRGGLGDLAFVSPAAASSGRKQEPRAPAVEGTADVGPELEPEPVAAEPAAAAAGVDKPGSTATVGSAISRLVQVTAHAAAHRPDSFHARSSRFNTRTHASEVIRATLLKDGPSKHNPR